MISYVPQLREILSCWYAKSKSNNHHMGWKQPTTTIITTTTSSRQNEDAGCSISLVTPGCIFDLKAPGGQPTDRADSSVAGRPSKTSGTVSGFSMQSMLCQAVAALSSHDAAQLTYMLQLSYVAIELCCNFWQLEFLFNRFVQNNNLQGNIPISLNRTSITFKWVITDIVLKYYILVEISIFVDLVIPYILESNT